MILKRVIADTPARHPLWAGMRADLPIEQAAWIGPERFDREQPLFLRLRRRFELPAGTHRFYLSADQRYQLWINGHFLAQGPDRSDLHHWSAAGYELRADGGPVVFELRLWWLPEPLAPLAQCTHRPGLVMKGEGCLDALLTTGKASWSAEDLSGAVSCAPLDLCGFHVVGPSFRMDMTAWDAPCPSVPMSVLRAPEEPERHGARPRGWRLHPSRLPEQRSERITGGVLRALRSPAQDGPWTASMENPALTEEFEAFLKGSSGAFLMPPDNEIEVLIDLETYLCAYPQLRISEGRGAELSLEWAESLFEADAGRSVKPDTPKGRRDEVEGKVFHGFGDSWRSGGASGVDLPVFWWRSGRYLRLILRTGPESLRLESFTLRRTGFPVQNDGRFTCDRPEMNALWPILAAGLEHCAHEQWVDCPYYEQLSYVGDHTATALGGYCLSREDTLTRRSLELFDWSRHENGWVAERYPSSIRQDSFTYAMLYPCLVRDYAYWRRDEAFVQSLLPGIRAMMHECLAWQGGDGLVHAVPGWGFVDWVPEWDRGCPPGAEAGDSSLVNLHLSRALGAWAELEAVCGEKGLIPWIGGLRARLNARIKSKYWSPESSLMADDSSRGHFSEHAQVWSLLSGVLTEAEQHACLRAWLSGAVTLAPMSIYFSHYGFEALYAAGESDAFFDRLRFWTALKAQGFHTTPERPEPSRSDCHGWGAHPLFHFFASIAGIRPASPGFRTVRISPMPGGLNHICLSLPHPDGALTFERVRRGDGRVDLRIGLPGHLTGKFVHGEVERPLEAGVNAFTVAG